MLYVGETKEGLNNEIASQKNGRYQWEKAKCSMYTD
jgi:hypothetical protein